MKKRYAIDKFDRERIGDRTMSRRNFAQILEEAKIDIRREYDRIIGSVFNFVSTAFPLIPEAGCGQSPQILINTGDSSNRLYCE